MERKEEESNFSVGSRTGPGLDANSRWLSAFLGRNELKGLEETLGFDILTQVRATQTSGEKEQRLRPS